MYHSRWSDLQDDDLKNNINCEKGADTVSGIIEPTSIPDYDNVKMFEGEETINMHYLRKIIEYCKEKKIEVLVTYLPHTAIDEHVAQSKYVKKICDEYNVNYINFLSDKDIVNYYIDFKDSIKINSHLNASGARKVTEYLGKYITEYYDIPNQKNNKSYDSWNDDYNKYIDFKIKKLASHKENINNYLILLYGEKDIKYKIELSSKMKIEKGSILEQLLENLDNKYEINDEVLKNDEKHKDNTIKITTWDNRNGKVIREVWF